MKKNNLKKQWEVPKLILFDADQVLSGINTAYGFEKIQYCQGTVLMTHTEAGISQTFLGLNADADGDAVPGATAMVVSGACPSP